MDLVQLFELIATFAAALFAAFLTGYLMGTKRGQENMGDQKCLHDQPPIGR